MALDLSSVCVGYAVFDDGELTSHGKYLQKGKGHGEKLTHFSVWLADLLKKADPDILVVEKPYPGRNKNAYRALTLYISKVLERHWQHFGEELPDESQLAAQSVKAALKFPKGQDHEDNKRIAVQEINNLYALALGYKRLDASKKTSDDDIADAIALGRTWIIKYRPSLLESDE